MYLFDKFNQNIPKNQQNASKIINDIVIIMQQLSLLFSLWTYWAFSSASSAFS